MCGIVAHLVLECLDTADTYTIDNTDAVLVYALQIHLAVFNSLYCRSHGELSVAVHLAGFLAVDIVVDVESLHLASELCLELGCVEMCDRCGSAYAFEKVLPSFLRIVSHWCNGTESCYYYSF